MDRLDGMNLFVSVADLRGFAPAARRHDLSPSVVTRAIAALEERLGTRLLQRTTRSVALTDAGARYLERARRILADVVEAETAAQADRAVPTGRFVLAAPTVFGRAHVGPVMSRFLARHPALVGELLLSDRVANLVDEGLDAAVRIGVLEDSSLVARQVGTTRRVIVGAPSYLARRPKLRTPEDLAAHDVVQLTSIQPTPEWRFAQGGREKRIGFSPRFVTNSVDAAIAHARVGAGLVLALGYQVASAVRQKKLRVVLADHEPPPVPIQIVYPSSRLLSAKVRAFVDLVTSTCDWRFVDL
jgi:DNA-binding transcriptional LysR family regulator